MAQTSVKKFTGALAKPIKLPPIPLAHAVHPDTEAAKVFYANRSNETERQRMMKLALLANHYGAKCNDIDELSGPMFLVLLYRLALDCVPGFLSSDDQSKKKVGRPNGDDAALLLGMVDFLRANGHAKTDLDAAAIVAEAFDDTLSAPRNRGARDKRARTIANSVSLARTSGKRKAEGKVH